MNLNDISIEPCFSFAVVPGRRYQKPPCRALHSNKPSCDRGSLLSCSLQGCRRQLHFSAVFLFFFCSVNKLLKSFSCRHKTLYVTRWSKEGLVHMSLTENIKWKENVIVVLFFFHIPFSSVSPNPKSSFPSFPTNTSCIGSCHFSLATCRSFTALLVPWR